jgi:hypothetical protein
LRSPWVWLLALAALVADVPKMPDMVAVGS